MKKVKVYDAIMGSGKTYKAIERMKSYLQEGIKFIYITPFKSEIHRIVAGLDSDQVFAPLDPDQIGTGKYSLNYNLIEENGNIDLNAEKSYQYLNKRSQFLRLASEGKNIVSSHALFLSLKRNDFNSFKDYILILDEVVEPLSVINIGAQDIEILREQELITINNDSFEVKFINDEYNDPAFRYVKTLCNNSSVFCLDKYFFVWVFSPELFNEFKEVQILTYLFEGSFLSAYFKLYNIDYLIEREESIEKLMEIKSLLNIYQGSAYQSPSLNSFSKSWIGNLSKSNAKSIAVATSNIFRRVFKTSSDKNAFTTFKSYEDKLAGDRFRKGFIAINARASNDYNHKESMAYLGNRYFDPQRKNFFRERNISLNEDLWALSELVQWVWRGCIRDGKPMNLYIPSRRMRELLLNWLNGEYLNSCIDS